MISKDLGLIAKQKQTKKFIPTSSKYPYTDYENEILDDLKDLKSSILEEGIKADKYVEIPTIARRRHMRK
jgi:hypothetical protein